MNVVDPLSEKFQHLAPYNYTDNNPANNTDPDGMDILYGKGVGGGDLYTGAYAQALFRQLTGAQQDDKGKKGTQDNKNPQDPKSTDKERQEAYDSWMNNLLKFNKFMLDVMEFKLFAEGFAEVSLSKLSVSTSGVTGLRAAYEAEVKGFHLLLRR